MVHIYLTSFRFLILYTYFLSQKISNIIKNVITNMAYIKSNVFHSL